jgi:uncharacterized membrane protein
MKLSERVFATLPWVSAMALIALIVHLVSVLLMPFVAPRDAYARLKEAEVALGLTENGVLMLPPVAPMQHVLPFEDPAVAEGACLFDLSKGALRLRAVVDGEDFLGVSLHQPSGAVFHALSDRAASKGAIEVVIGDARQIDELEAEDAEGAVVQEVRVVAPSKRGFALIRALAQRSSDFDAARALVAAASCKLVGQ